MMILKNKLCGSAARLGRGFQTRPFLTAVRHKVNNLERSVVVQELELELNLALWGFMEFR